MAPPPRAPSVARDFGDIYRDLGYSIAMQDMLIIQRAGVVVSMCALTLQGDLAVGGAFEKARQLARPKARPAAQAIEAAA